MRHHHLTPSYSGLTTEAATKTNRYFDVDPTLEPEALRQWREFRSKR